MKIILGSSSPSRRRVLEEAGISFEVVKPDIDEKKIRAEIHEYTPVILSYAKARAVAEKVDEPAFIIACDQVIVCNGNILEKPESPDDVRSWYELYSKYPVNYINGITVFDTSTKASLTAQEISIANFIEVPAEFIEEQIKKGKVFNCAGGIYSEIQDKYATIVQGSRESTSGLPVKFVFELIEKLKLI